MADRPRTAFGDWTAAKQLRNEFRYVHGRGGNPMRRVPGKKKNTRTIYRNCIILAHNTKRSFSQRCRGLAQVARSMAAAERFFFFFYLITRTLFSPSSFPTFGGKHRLL